MSLGLGALPLNTYERSRALFPRAPESPGEGKSISLSPHCEKLQFPCSAKLAPVTQINKCGVTSSFFLCLRNPLRTKNCPVSNRKSSCLLSQQEYFTVSGELDILRKLHSVKSISADLHSPSRKHIANPASRSVPYYLCPASFSPIRPSSHTS